MLKSKYGVIYTDGSAVGNPVVGAGCGYHGYIYDELNTSRFAGVPLLIGPGGYQPKLTGPQLKDSEYNPVLSDFDIEIDVKANKVSKECDLKVVDYIRPLGQVSNNRGEMIAFIDAVRNEHFECEKYIVYSDSKYLIDGWCGSLKQWIERGWALSSGGEVKNRDLWEQINEILDTMGDRIDLRKIKAHSGEYGNESADRNAKYGSYCAENGHVESHFTVCELNDKDYWEPVKLLPTLLHQKWCYSWSETEREFIDCGDVRYHKYFMGDHNKTADDAELLGKHMSDAGFSLIYAKSETPIIDRQVAYHSERLWKGVDSMYRSEIVISVNTSTMMRPKVIWELNRVPLANQQHITPANELVSSRTKELISKAHNPPKLTYRMRDVEDEYHKVMMHYLQVNERGPDGVKPVKMQGVTFNDVTECFYEVVTDSKGKESVRLSDKYDLVCKSIEFQIDQPCTGNKAKIILVRGIDLPSRQIMAKLAGHNTKVNIVAVKFDEIIFKHYLIIESDEGMGIWSSYACLRVLDPKRD